VAGDGELRQHVDWQNGLIAPAIHFDEDVYRLEAQHVFNRAWLVVGHEDMVRKPGDYITNYMGEVPVIVVRDRYRSTTSALIRPRGETAMPCPAAQARTAAGSSPE
jgi:hypothetical protein